MTVVLLLLMLAMGVLALVALDQLVRRPVLGAGVALWLVVVDAFLDPQLISVHLAGFRVSIPDIGFSLLALAAVMRLARAKGTKEQALIALLGAVVVVSLVLGVGTIAVDRAMNEFRGFQGFISAALYFSTVPLDGDTLRSILRVWFGAGIGMGGVVALRWTGRLLGIDLGLFDETFDATIRVLGGPPTMFLASTSVVLLLSGLYGAVANPRLYQRVGTVLLIMSIVLNRRTAWLALAVALIGLLIRERRIGRRAATVAILGLALFTLVLPLFAESSDQDRMTARSADDVGTLLWRMEGWAGLLESGPQEPAEYVIGLPFGSGWERTVSGSVQGSNPHSFYLQTYLRTGLTGLAMLLSVLSIAFFSLWANRREPDMPLSGDVLVLLLMMQAVWLLTWPPLAEQGLILGLAAAQAGRLRRAGTTFSSASETRLSSIGSASWSVRP